MTNAVSNKCYGVDLEKYDKRRIKNEQNTRQSVTYRAEIPQGDYLPVVQLEEEVTFRPELKEKLRQWLASWVGLAGDQNRTKARTGLKSQWLEEHRE